MTQLPFTTPFPRPTEFSPRLCEIFPEITERILDSRDADLSWHEYRFIFDYDLLDWPDEVLFPGAAYFLPSVFAFMRDAPSDSFEIHGDVVSFVRTANAFLSSAGLLAEVHRAFADCLRAWTARFEIVHYGHNAPELGGSRLRYQDIVQNCDYALGVIQDLVDRRTDAAVADAFVAELSRPDATPTQSAWFLELAGIRYSPRCRIRKGPTLTILSDETLHRRAAEIASRDPSLMQGSPTYWPDLKRLLNL